jgi:hypothetical protein
MRWAYQRRFKNGISKINTTRFLGYDKGKVGNLIINEEQATIVRRIFKNYLSGLGISKIAQGLKVDGIRNISGKGKNEQIIWICINHQMGGNEACEMKTVKEKALEQAFIRVTNREQGVKVTKFDEEIFRRLVEKVKVQSML